MKGIQSLMEPSSSGSTRHLHGEQLEKLEQSLKNALAIVQNTRRENLRPIDWLDTAAKVGVCLAESRDALAEVRQDVVGGARAALLLYFRSHQGKKVSPQELEGVAAIRAWARRIRELRAFGWDIDTLGAGPEAPYRLNAPQLEESVASSEATIVSVGGTSPAERLIEYLLHISPWPASPQQLERVAKVPTWRQEIRELVDQGWLIQSHDDDPEVSPGHYRLANLEL
ncbi:hypothetical protein [Streptosporangium sp. NBC_01756]|uniref:hypothetical protein n=1 Tax=Streptosporangium sp. NBC_01756 TaxID=2975950 RepID=UPI002DD93B16|nr:hypothetical protein [Streptosporangium sp. NBC_01756]WSC89641.1 hypothetical protein OIE48_16095 [Streptosporangium sp. NBC_01756]